MKDLCLKWNVKLIIRGGAYGLSGTGIVDCLEIIVAGCNMKQFYGLTRLALIPHILRQIYASDRQ